MNEEQKNIETCLPENILAEVASVTTDPQFVSLVNESLDPLKQQAFQQAGSDAYNEVVASHKPYTFTSSVRQMKSNLILLLRRLWRFPFGSGTIRSLSDADTIPSLADAGSLGSLSDAAPRSLADMWSHYIHRLSGNAEYGIPSRLSQLSDLPSAPVLLSDRTITGVPEAVDGMSLLHLLNDLSGITELTDDNEGWTASGNEIKALIAKCPNLTKMQSKAAQIVISGYSSVFDRLGDVDFRYASVRGTSWGYGLFAFGTHSQPVNLKIKEINYSGDTEILYGTADIVNLYCERIITGWHTFILHAGSVVRELNMKDTYYIESTRPAGEHNIFLVGQSSVTAEALEIVRFGTMHKMDRFYLYDSATYNPVNLTLIEFGEGTDCNINLSQWSPTLDSSNLQQFLSNFRSFIVLRLANRKTTTALTLTLSAAVYNAVTGANSGWASQHTLAELGITDNDLTDLETELGITSATIYATWLDTYTGANGIHWNVNKAN